MTNYLNNIFIFIGPEGAGKSTQARLLAKETALPYLSTGDVLRSFAINDTGFLGEASRRMFEQNGYLDAKLINTILENTLKKSLYKNGFILDGSLRTYEETDYFNTLLKKINLQMPVTVFYISIPKEESIVRLMLNRKREDDTIQGIETRLSHFHDRLDDRLQIITQRYTLIEIDGMPMPETVHKDVMNSIKKRN